MLNRLDLLTANDRAGRHPPSWYSATANRQTAHAPLAGTISCDVCVIGGGYTGLSAALHLAGRGYDVVLLEAHRLGWGASGRNGGQVGSGQRLDQITLERQLGEAHAQRLWGLAEEAKALVADLIARHAIACDFVHGVLHADHRRSYVAESRAYAEHLQSRYGYDLIRFVDGKEMAERLASPAYFGGTLDAGAGHLHPLNFALGLAAAGEAAGVRFFEESTVTGYEPGDPVRVTTPGGSVSARFLVLGCNGYLGRLDRTVSAHVMPINNFIIATEPLSESEAETLIAGNVAVADSKFVINYFRRSSDNRLLFGGGENYGYRFPSDIKAFVRRPMLQVFPQLKDVRIDYGWGGTLAITPRRMPYFSRLSPNVLAAGGYSGHGVAMATLAGRLLAEAVDGTAGRFEVFESLKLAPFPGGDRLRFPLLVLAMTWFALRDRLGI
ncbi:NAD(P)/FAD-dependent oxidoreductase [Polymorphum gilvum]|uniref:FAD dependent oxidoreductase, putative n=1 Tax=Polymorphum gilvum (strain LMG 25793 / CGMCC 1.9160 / SL003B-26A1) TaxID=991905 RepID=F2J1D5_POLGS|nr:FAD-binding oxidoreductase [Polymorphum gilvum]ADZ69717.1 FAD dependent oxidoreductase, putative [Polymorphum gilvum SL003B-26A1]